MRVEAKLAEMGITLPDYSKEGYPGATFGTMKSHHRVGNVLYLSGHVPWKDGGPTGIGTLGKDVTIEKRDTRPPGSPPSTASPESSTPSVIWTR